MELVIAILIQLGFLTSPAEEYTELPENIRYEENIIYVDTGADEIVTIDTDEWI